MSLKLKHKVTGEIVEFNHPVDARFVKLGGFYTEIPEPEVVKEVVEEEVVEEKVVSGEEEGLPAGVSVASEIVENNMKRSDGKQNKKKIT